jgi:CBS domain containing-hemolysin-like protein
MEEIFGEIQDEYDVNEATLYQPFGEHTYVLNARLDIDTLGKLLDLDLDEEESDTLGGLIYSRLGHVPVQGETVDLDGWRLRVLSLDGRRINQVRADRVLPPVEENEQEPARSKESLRLRSRKAGIDPAQLDPSRLDPSGLANHS